MKRKIHQGKRGGYYVIKHGKKIYLRRNFGENLDNPNAIDEVGMYNARKEINRLATERLNSKYAVSEFNNIIDRFMIGYFNNLDRDKQDVIKKATQECEEQGT